MSAAMAGSDALMSEALIYQMVVERILARVEGLPKEQKHELAELVEDIDKSRDEKDRQEIKRTMLEILIPDLIGGLMFHPMKRTDGAFLQSRAQYIGERIREKREGLGWTQQDLAEKSGLPQSHISRLESGVHGPTNHTLQKIAKAMKVNVSRLDYSEEQ